MNSESRFTLELAAMLLLVVVLAAVKDVSADGHPRDERILFVVAILFVAVLAAIVGVAFATRRGR